MEKIILNDGTDFEIKEGATLELICFETNDFTILGTIAEGIMKDGNLSNVRFETDGVITGEYNDMKLETPLFKYVDVQNGKVQAAFSIREKTEVEKRLDVLENGQNIQDEAIVELAEMVGGNE